VHSDTLPPEPEIAFRKAVPTDRPFVERVYFTTHRHIIEALFGWRGDDVERRKFEESYDEASTAIIVVQGEDVGWLTVRRRPDQLDLDSIYLRGESQRQGIGTRIICDLIREAAAAGVPLRLSTAKINDARRLYQRLGFRTTGEDELKFYMEVR